MKRAATLALCSILLLAAPACRTAGAPGGRGADAQSIASPAADLDYSIRPIPRAGRVDLEVTLRFRGSASGATVIHLPEDRYGTPNVHEAVVRMSAGPAAAIESADAPAKRLIRHPPAAPIELTYSISWDPSRSEGYAYSPDVSASHFHFMGPQWIVRPEGYENEINLEVGFESIPAGWSVLSSFGLGPGPHVMKDVTLTDLGSFIAGGAYRLHDFSCAGRPVRIGIAGTFTLDDRSVFENTEKIVCAERRWMNDESQPFYTISITPRDGIRAGTAIANAFVALVDPEITERRLATLLAHEMFHYWMLGRARVVGSDFDDAIWASKWAYQWVDEGFTEYFARKILHETGLLGRGDLVDLSNEDIVDFWRNEHRSIPYGELRRAAEERRFMNTHQRIGYYRGALIALDWDTRIRESTQGARSLSDAIREIVARAVERGGHLPEAEFHGIMEGFGIDSAQAFDAVIVRGEPPPVNPRAYLPDFVLGETTIREFAPGFDVHASRREKKIVGIVPGGHADAAGLREGMEIVRLENSQYYDPEEPMRVTIREGESERTIELHPKGAALRIPEYRRSDG